jgi:hypothetical protein
MPARITVKAELASLLAKSQETTDANRRAQLQKEADQQADRKRLEAKKANEDAARKKPLEDPVGRNIFTAAMGGQPLEFGRIFYRLPVGSGPTSFLRVWSGNAATSVDVTIPIPEAADNRSWNVATGPPAEISPGVFRYVANTFYSGHAASDFRPVYSELGGDWDAIENFTDAPFDFAESSTGYTAEFLPHILPLRGNACIFLITWASPLWRYLWTYGLNEFGSGPDFDDLTLVSEYTEIIKGAAAFYVNDAAVRQIDVPEGIEGRETSTFVPFNDRNPLLPIPQYVPPAEAYYYLGSISNGNIDYTPVQYLWFGEANRAAAEAGGFGLTDAEVRPLLPAGANNFYNLLVYSRDWNGIPPLPLNRLAINRTAYLWVNTAAPIPAENVPPLSGPDWRKPVVRVPVDLDAMPQDQTTVNLFWDWSKPGYCRDQLLALGFTTADFTPLPPP